VADTLSLDKVTDAPPAGAALLNVTVPVEELPPFTLVGFRVKFESTGGLMVSVAVCGPLYVPVIVAETTTPTTLVVTVNVAVFAPATTVTLAGTVAAALLLDSVTIAPPVGAGPFSIRVPVEELPPSKLAGFSVTLESAGGLMVSVAVCTALKSPVIVTVATVLTALVVTVNVAVVAPAATVTLAGTAAAALLLESETNTPPDGAGPLKVNVPVEEVLPTKLDGFMETDISPGASSAKKVVCVPL
jgi:hypothetical protein